MTDSNNPDYSSACMTPADVEMLTRDTLYQGFFSLVRYRFRHRLFNGQMSPVINREIFERGHAAVLLAYDPKRDEVVLIEQLRIAALDTSPTPWLLELIAGIIEPSEHPEQVVRREAHEEAGIAVQRCQHML
ncbi:MAG: NUDIX domain-containing protein, partial [Plesiomonas sp.]